VNIAPYGTGKTLLAFHLALDAIENNWVFIYLKDPTLLAQTLRLGKVIDKNGNGVVIFVEDIDQVTRGNRDSAMQDILNTLDGGDSKQMNVISLFTTNHIELIEPTFLRGKRIGSIISLTFLDKKTAKKFIDFTFSKDNYVVDDQGSDAVLDLIEKSNIAPAFMAEITESVKSNMILSDDNIVKYSYIENSVRSYLHQVDLSRKKDMSVTPEAQLADSLTTVVTGELSKEVKNLKDKIEKYYN
jgi:SpoVK/Ycf46/Vps4 family AAA+-type ATPase